MSDRYTVDPAIRAASTRAADEAARADMRRLNYQRAQLIGKRCGHTMCHVHDCLDCYPKQPHSNEAKKVKPPKKGALGAQVGGDHYTAQTLQPIEMCYQRYGYEGVKATLHTKVDKYLTRTKDDELEQFKKARHCLDLLIDFYQRDNA